MRPSFAAFVQFDDQMPEDRHHRLWVQSPNGTWVLLSGGWSKEHIAEKFALSAGYSLIDSAIGVHQVEQQMKESYDRAGRPVLHASRIVH